MTTEYDPAPEVSDTEEPEVKAEVPEKEQSGGALRAKAYTDLDPAIGIGKAAAVTYDGDPDGLVEYVEVEYGYTGPENPMAATIRGEQARLDQIANRLVRCHSRHRGTTNSPRPRHGATPTPRWR